MKNNMKSPVFIPASKLHPFEGHPYKVRDDEEMNSLTESVIMQGVLSPLIVRPLEGTTDEYEIVSGHRRFRAAVKAGMDEIPAFIRPMSRDEAVIALVDSNLHREHILPSEKAFAYKLKADALRHQGQRSDLAQLPWEREADTSDQPGPKLTAEMISADDSATQVKRYIRLTRLIPEILDMVDEGRIAFTPAVELSYLNDIEQHDLYETIQAVDATPNLSQAQALRRLSADVGLTPERIDAILSQEKANQKERLRIPMEDIRRFFPKSYTTMDIQRTILRLCEDYHRRQMREREHEAR